MGVALRLAFAIGYWRDRPLTHDEQEYLVLALNLAGGHGFSRDFPGVFDGPSVNRFSRAPLYPAFLSVVFRATGQDTRAMPASVPAAVQVVQALLGAWLVVVVWRLARRAGGERAGTIAAWMAACHPALVWMGAYALSEVVYAPLALTATLLLARATDIRAAGRSGRPGDTSLAAVAASGVLLGLAGLVRSAALVATPFLVLRLAWLRRLGPAILFGAMVAATVLPWTCRNYVTYGRPIVVAADGGVTFWTGNHPLARGEGDLAANPDLGVLQREFLARHDGLGPEDLEPLYYAEALGFIRRDPARWLGLTVRKLFYTFVPIGPSYLLHSALYYWASVVPYALLFPLAVLGGIRLLRGPLPPSALLTLAASQVLVCLVFFPQERFRIPVIDPTLIVCAAAWLARHDPGAPGKAGR